MLKKISFVVILIVVTAFSFVNQVLAYSNQAKHYSFSLPSDWEEIPKSVIEQYMNEIVKQTNGKRIEYASGFQLAGSEHFKYPYILVQEHKINTPSYSQLEKVFSDNKFQETVDRKSSEYSKLLDNATADKPFINKERNIIFMNIQHDVADLGRVNSLTTMFLGKNDITQLNFYSTENEYSKQLPAFNSIIDSFKYDDGYGYDPVDAKGNDSPSVFEGVFEEGISGAIAGGFLMLFIGLIGILFRKRKKSDSEVNRNMDAIKYCKECGNEINASDMTCNKCGKETNKK